MERQRVGGRSRLHCLTLITQVRPGAADDKSDKTRPLAAFVISQHDSDKSAVASCKHVAGTTARPLHLHLTTEQICVPKL